MSNQFLPIGVQSFEQIYKTGTKAVILIDKKERAFR